MTESIGDILASCDFFAEIQEDSLDRLASMARQKHYAKGELIFRQGEPCPGLFVVGTGSVRIFKAAASGKEHVLHIVGPGGTFAEVAVIGRFACPAFAEAVKETSTVLLPRGPLVRELESNHALCLQLMGGMARRVRHFVGLMEDIVLRDASERLARYLLEVGAGESEPFTLPKLKKDLASQLNITSETLSRTLRRLADAGLIEQLDGQRLRIVRREELQYLADGIYPWL